MKNLETEFNGKRWEGSCELSEFDAVWYGKILGINGVVTYESNTLNELQGEFEKAVREYCEGYYTKFN